MFFIIKENRTLRNVFIITALALLAAAGVGFFGFLEISGPLIIHFNFLGGGIDFLGGKGDVAEILFFGFLAAGINFLLANFVYERERFLSYIFAFAGLIVAALVLIAVAFISTVN